MAIRIVGVDLPQNKRGEIALTYIYGIGRSSSAKILDKAGVSRDLKAVSYTHLTRNGAVSAYWFSSWEMKIFLKTEDEIELMRKANHLVGETLAELAKHIKPGVTTLQLDLSLIHILQYVITAAHARLSAFASSEVHAVVTQA